MFHKSTYVIFSQFFFFEDVFFRRNEILKHPFRFLTSRNCLSDSIASGCSDVNIFDGRFWLEMGVKETSLFEDEYKYHIPGFGNIRTEEQMLAEHSHPDEYFKVLGIKYSKIKSPFIPFLGPIFLSQKSVPFLKRRISHRQIRDILKKSRDDLFGLNNKDQSISHIPFKAGKDLNFTIKCGEGKNNQIIISDIIFHVIPKLRVYIYPYGICMSHVILKIAASQKYNTSHLIKLLRLLFFDKVKDKDSCEQYHGSVVCNIGKFYSGKLNTVNDFIGEYLSKVLFSKNTIMSITKLPQNTVTCLNFEADIAEESAEKEIIGILNKDLNFNNYSKSFISSYSSFYGKFSGDFTISTDTNLVLSFGKDWTKETKKKTRVVFYWIIANIFFYNIVQKNLNRYFKDKIQNMIEAGNNSKQNVLDEIARISSWVDGNENEHLKLISSQRKIYYRMYERLHVDKTRYDLALIIDNFQKRKDRVLNETFTKNIYEQLNSLRENVDFKLSNIIHKNTLIENKLSALDYRQDLFDESLNLMHEKIQHLTDIYKKEINEYELDLKQMLGYSLYSCLDNNSKLFLLTAEFLYDKCDPNSDYSAAMIEFCKALELELNGKLITRLIKYINQDVKKGYILAGNKKIGEKYSKNLTLGSFPYLLADSWESFNTRTKFSNKRYDSDCIPFFDKYFGGFNVTPLEARTHFACLLQAIAEYRNKAAHIDGVSKLEVSEVREEWEENRGINLLLMSFR